MTDRERCDWLAVHAMGWTKRPAGCGWTSKHGKWVKSWNPHNNANDTNRLMDAMRADGWGYRITQHRQFDDAVNVTFWRIGIEGSARHINRKRAVCLAAYEALKGRTNEK